MSKSIARHIWDFIGIPFRMVLLDQRWLPRFGWTTLEEERMIAVLPNIKGRLLDIGAGQNTLVNRYGDGVGVEVFDWGGGAVVVEDSSKLPFGDGSFDTITMIAALNHIPNRNETLCEARRIIKRDGRLIITMIGPALGNIGHKVWWHDENKKRGGMKDGELGGLSAEEITLLCESAGFRLARRVRFVYGMNNLYIFNPVAEKGK